MKHPEQFIQQARALQVRFYNVKRLAGERF